MGLEPKQPGRVGKHRPRIRPGKSFTLPQLEEDLGVTPAHVRVGFAFGRRVAEVAPPVDDLLWRATADPELKPAVGNEIGRARVLDHVERILVSHVDDGRADLDAVRPRADGGEQREGRTELLRKVVDAKVCAVRTELLSRDSQLDRLLQDIARGARYGPARCAPMTEG